MRVLVACEYSGTVRDAMRARGHDAMSCDLLPSDRPGPHYQGSVIDLLFEPYDLVIAHPPCTYLANSGVQYLTKQPDRYEKMEEAAGFFWLMSQFNSPRIAIENPVQHTPGREAHGLGRPTQYVDPWMFGVPQTKKTGLWLFNLPPLVPTDDVRWHLELLPIAERQPMWWGKDLDIGSENRWKIRSTTFPCIAEAMADQWGIVE